MASFSLNKDLVVYAAIYGREEGMNSLDTLKKSLKSCCVLMSLYIIGSDLQFAEMGFVSAVLVTGEVFWLDLLELSQDGVGIDAGFEELHDLSALHV